MNKKNKVSLLTTIIFILMVVTTRLIAADSTNQNLRPVAGAFGWKLGDKLPEQFRSEIKCVTNDISLTYTLSYSFKPKTEMPPFTLFSLELTGDGKIYQISAFGMLSDDKDLSVYRDSLISLLSEKYGLRNHVPGSGEYEFGTENQTARLLIERSIFSLIYYDKKLQEVAQAESESKREKILDEKKAALKNDL